MHPFMARARCGGGGSGDAVVAIFLHIAESMNKHLLSISIN